jgi:Bifunctional DNA primase/polymerase, N-terminal/AAA domain/Primase C terminal 2 (PriCT-2)
MTHLNTSLVEAALALAALGKPVFPCWNIPNDEDKHKTPMVKRGFHAATTDPTTIKQWWRKWPEALIGMATGEVSGIAVLDLDVKKGKNGYAAVPDWKNRSHVIVKTGSSGAHLYFDADGAPDCTSDTIALGVDTRGNGGYAIVPPSPGYTWVNGSDLSDLPPWPDDLRPPDRRRPPTPEWTTASSSSTESTWLKERLKNYRGDGGLSNDPADLPLPLDLATIKAALAVIDPDVGRTEWIAIGCALYKHLGSDEGFAIWDEWSSGGGKYRPRTMKGQWLSIAAKDGYDYNIGTLIYHANEADPNWRGKIEEEPAEAAADDPPPAADEPATTDGPTTDPPPNEEKPRTDRKRSVHYPPMVELASILWGQPTPVSKYDYRFGDDGSKSIDVIKSTWVDFEGDVRGGNFASLLKLVQDHQRNAGQDATEQKLRWYDEADPAVGIDWLVQDLVPKIGSGLISGQAGTYKTFVALDLAAAIATGKPFLNFQTRRQGGVLYFAPEGGDTIAVRTRALMERKHDGAKMPFAWANFSPRLMEQRAVDDMVKIAVEASAKMEADFNLPLAMIVVDTIAVAAGYGNGEENDASTAQLVMSTLAALGRRTTTFVFGIDHFGKDVETGTRGSSAKEAAADVVLALLGKKDVTGMVSNPRLALRKRRSGANGLEFNFRVATVDLGVDQYGERMTSIVVDWLSGATHQSREDWWNSKPAARTLREALGSALHDHGIEFRPRNYVTPVTVKAVSNKIVRKKFHEFYPPPAEEDPQKRRKKVWQTFDRAFKEAQEHKLIEAQEEGDEVMVWESRQFGEG